MNASRCLALFAVCVFASGCLTGLQVTGGPYLPDETAAGAERGAVIAGRTTFGKANYGAGASFSVRSSEALSRLAWGAEGYYRAWGGPFVPYVVGGFQLAQAEWLFGDPVFGAFSPSLEAGLIGLFGESTGPTRPGVSLGLSLEHDVRFGRADQTYVAVLLGLGFFGDGERNARPAPSAAE